MPTPFKTLARVVPIALTALTLGAFTGCEKGPAEQAGSKIDKGVDNVKDAINPPSGPGGAAGRAIDRATK